MREEESTPEFWERSEKKQVHMIQPRGEKKAVNKVKKINLMKKNMIIKEPNLKFPMIKQASKPGTITNTTKASSGVYVSRNDSIVSLPIHP